MFEYQSTTNRVHLSREDSREVASANPREPATRQRKQRSLSDRSQGGEMTHTQPHPLSERIEVDGEGGLTKLISPSIVFNLQQR